MTLTSHSETAASATSGLFYDGVSSRAHQVTIRIVGNTVCINGNNISRTIPISKVSVSEPFDGAHRILRFQDGATCEVPDSNALSGMLKRAGHGDSLVVRLQQRWRWVAISFALLIIVLFAIYRMGLPWAAEKLAFRLPDKALGLISQQTLSSIDGKWLLPSTLPPERQKQLRERFAHMAFPSGKHVVANIQFRSSAMFGANAFALPDGTIVFLDKLVELAENDDQIVAVFAHEAGHVVYRHGVRQIIQSSVVALVLAAYVGDVSTLAGALTGWLLEAKYSRDFERDADRFAGVVLQRNNMSPGLLGSFLIRLEEDHKKHKGDSSGSKVWDYISTHPPTAERMKEMQALPKQ